MEFPEFLKESDIEELKVQEAKSDAAQKRTPEQIEAIYANGQNILVSASAGSGKTFVMVQRIIDKILRGVSIEEMFISTFTVKAATELKERIEKGIVKEIKESSSTEMKAYLNHQLLAIYQADIGTMDAFTQKLVSEYGYLLGISPKFRILQDKSEQDVLKQSVYDNLFEHYFNSEQHDLFIKLVKNFSGNRKTSQGFKDLVYSIHSFSQSTEAPEQWLETKFLKSSYALLDHDAIPNSVIQTLLTEMQVVANQLRDLTDSPDYKQKKADGKTNTVAYKNHLTIIDQLFEWSTHFDHYFGKSKVGQLAQELTNLLPAGDDVTVNKVKYPIYKKLQSLIQELRHLDTIFKYQPETLPLLELLKRFVKDFTSQYLQAKMTENTYEFSDISHFAIQLLENNPDLRLSYQKRYHEVMVDEYQDNNHTQERMLELLSNGQNRFMVGDIKQSIYRFRQADPHIFNSTFEDYKSNPKNGKLILLKENFRSQEEVIAATNDVFTHLMDKEVGDILYDETHQLVAGSDRQKVRHSKNKCQVLIYDKEQSLNDSTESENDIDDSNDLSPGESKLVAKEIIRLTKEEGVPFSDITLLVSSRTRNDSIRQTFNHYGIPLVTDGGQDNYLKSVEVLVMLETLRTIDNPLNDYSLVALMRSPMFQFDEDQLARIALQESDSPYSETYFQKIENALAGKGENTQLISNELEQKLIQFINILEDWRQYAKTNSLYDLIWKIYNDRFYFDIVGKSVKAEQAQANLYALAIRASQFEKNGFKGLSRFVSMINTVLDSQNDLADVVVTPPKNAVSLMTIHKSKGLEFPYVFILGCDKKFSMTDLNAPAIIDRENGIGIKYLADLKNDFEEDKLASIKTYLETLPYQFNKRLLKRATLSEQMRLLYVAMTRAEKRLYLVGKGSQSKLTEKFDGNIEGHHIPLSLRENVTTFQDWLLAIYQAFKSEKLAFDVTFIGDDSLKDNDIGFVEKEDKINPENLKDNRQTESIARALDMLERVDLLNQGFKAAIQLPTVRTPSQIKKFYQPIIGSDGVDIIEKPTYTKPSFKLPDFSNQSPVEASQVGSALHELMQRITISEHVTREDIQTALELVDTDDSIKSLIDITKVFTFFESTELGQLIQTNKEKLHREAPFAILKRDSESQEKYVIRGIIDGFLLFDDRIILFDYKTDKYQNRMEMKDRYTLQLNLYAEALMQSYGIEKIEKYLILLGGKELEVFQI